MQLSAPTAGEPLASASSEAEPATCALDGARLRRLLAVGTRWLERNAASINALNVFPVPDGDTGTNMLLTMRAAVEATAGPAGGDAACAGQVMRAAARGAVMGARGNAGVILSQIVAGMAHSMGESPTCDARLLARALADGADTAYRAVPQPVEGTILTVARAASAAAVAAADQAGAAATCRQVLDQALAAARAAVERTPEQLAILRQAGVVDAGGEGYRVILEGMALAERGEPLPDEPDTPAVQTEAQDALGIPQSGRPFGADLNMVPVEEWGYCTQFVVSGERLDVASVRRSLQLLAASALVVGDESLIRVHGHTQDPGQLLSYAAKLGRLQRIAIEDMDAQHDAWLRTQVADTKAAVQAAPEESGGCAAPAAEVTTVAVAPGEGLAEVFRSVGAGEVVLGGQTMNPSAQELLAAAQRTGAGTVLLLPNNANVILAARQAADLAEPGLQLVVVPTRTVPQGIAAQLAFSAEAGAEENAGVMEQAAGAVRTVEVTRATRSVTLDGMAVREGDALGLLDDQPVAVAPDAIAAAARALDLAGAATAGIITIYGGRDVGDEAARAFVDALRERYSQAEVEVVHGGQPHFDYLISVE